ncbi:unnamed protein product [Didymodactylos carnosus]|uniref:SKICH domain-containing protein n=1 Tax=Didymodactylos carnosus TaxID=1234261 RepID=A0A813QD48_9BILA|nr:unnamed protein product [Didymodactylos carnosus]CAF0765097.1 unnamed protein product [Didymodactylos carnosus]CAF3493623.1 unnamed protein product [Didymodactylos carnosus]CAF3546357.1 unnamed protein product [Didymodactylos carnosus]
MLPSDVTHKPSKMSVTDIYASFGEKRALFALKMSDNGSDISNLSLSSLDDQVVFENVRDQYLKGQNICCYFYLLKDVKTSTDDKIGLFRVGCTNVKDSLAFAKPEILAESNGSMSGQAIFLNDSLPKSDEEFYQFCYILSSTNRSIGSSIPFQLNCLDDDICAYNGEDEQSEGHHLNPAVNKRSANDLVTIDTVGGETNGGGDVDFIVIQTKHILTEEKLKNDCKQLLSINRKLEKENDQLKMQMDQIEIKSNEIVNKMNQDIIAREKQHASLASELDGYNQREMSLKADYLQCRELYQTQSETVQLYLSKLAELEVDKQELETKIKKVRLLYDDAIEKLQMQTQTCKHQQIQIGKLRVMNVDNLKEQRCDLKMSHEKHLMSVQKQLDIERNKFLQLSSSHQDLTSRYELVDDQMKALASTNAILKDELKQKAHDNEQLHCVCFEKSEMLALLEERYNLKQCETETFQQQMGQAKSELELIRTELEDLKANQQSHNALKLSYSVVEKRCLKHQKQEKDYKKQVDVLQDHIRDQQNEINELRDRLHEAGSEYKTIYRKYLQMQRHNSGNDKDLSSSASISSLQSKTKMTDRSQIPLKQVPVLSTSCNMKDLVWDAEKKPFEQGNEHQEQQSFVSSLPQTTTMSNETGINEEMLVNLLRQRYIRNPNSDEDQASSFAYDSDQDLDVGSPLLPESGIQLINTDETAVTDPPGEIKQCPLCFMEFPSFTLDAKREHIETHFS